jgi:hypothetical protein
MEAAGAYGKTNRFEQGASRREGRVRRGPRARRLRENAPRTLPLFGAAGENRSLGSGRPSEEPIPQDLVLQVYWSAAVHTHALASAASRSASARERWALRRLAEVEEQRRELAGQLLGQVWGIRLAA